MIAREIVRACTPRSLRNWCRKPTRSLSYCWNYARYALGVTQTVEICDGCSLRCHPLSAEYFNIFRRDPDQASELSAFVRHCRPGMALLDLGAHYGPFTLAALCFGGATAQAVCVEASRMASKVLHENLSLNGAMAQCRILNVAIGDADGYLTMLSTGPFSGDYMQAAPEGRRDVTRVPCRTIESVLSQTGFVPTHLKIDIEGSEFEVIRASRRVLTRLQPLLFLELHGALIAARGKRPAQVIDDLRECGYRRFEINGAEVTPTDLEARKHDCRLICRA